MANWMRSPIATGTRMRLQRRPGTSWVRSVTGRLVRAEEGATLVEMAIASIAFFSVFFGLMTVGYALYVYDFVSDAAREACRYAIVRGAECTGFTECTTAGGGPGASVTDISNYVVGLNYPGIDPSKMTVTAEWYAVKVDDSSNGNTTSYTDCGNDPTAIKYYNEPCNYPGNTVRIQVFYNLPFSIPFWQATTITMGSQSELTISQ